MPTADILENAAPDDPDLPLAKAMIKVLLADHMQVVAKVKKALANPSPDDRRALQGRLIALRNREDSLTAALIALADEGRSIPTPPQDLVDSLAALSGKVEAATNANLTASKTLDLATQFVSLATEVMTTLKV
jgi:hypothetical protein